MITGMAGRRMWLLYLVVYLVALVPYQFVPFGTGTTVYFLALAWSGAIAMTGRLLYARPRRAGALWLLALAEVATAAGVAVLLLLDPASPGPEDVLFVLGNLCEIAAMVWLVRLRIPGHDRESMLDATVIACGFALLCWVFLVKPARLAAGSETGALIGMAYPVMDLFVFALLVRMLLGGGLRSPAMRLIALAQMAFLASDAAFAFVPAGLQQSPAVMHVMTAASLSVYGLFGAAALHPTFTLLTAEPAPTVPDRPWLRTPLLCGAVMAGPVLLLAQAWQFHSKVPDAVAIAVGCAVVFALVVARLQTLVARVNAQSVVLSQQAERLQVLASRDGLTGLVNRRAWDSLLAEGLERGHRDGVPTTLAILDLDHFKRYNDSNGHQAGDRLLKAAAAAWTAQLRQVDVLARYGGEEFIALLPGCPAPAATEVLERLRAATPDGQTISAGIATWDGRETADQLVARADAALYQAKSGGRDRSVVAQPA
ncbi:MAG TPA: GGDEF domain-containing protein [Rugosimonospora sp.]|nr:GGDEF domain-containing protein [Rugosimonospora sp.]